MAKIITFTDLHWLPVFDSLKLQNGVYPYPIPVKFTCVRFKSVTEMWKSGIRTEIEHITKVPRFLQLASPMPRW